MWKSVPRRISWLMTDQGLDHAREQVKMILALDHPGKDSETLHA